MKMLLSTLISEMCHRHRIILKNKVKKENWARGLGKRRKENIWKGVGLLRGPHEIAGLETCILLINYLTQTSIMMTSKL